MKIGDFVVNTKTGSIGLLARMSLTTNRCTVRHGASGPTAVWALSNARRATLDEIADAGLSGVGCNQADDA